MKKLLIALSAILITGSLFAQGIKFEHGTLAEAQALAKKENKMIFMDCYTTWCGPCKALSKNVFPTKEVGDVFNDKFINLKMDCEKGEGPEVAKKYGVAAYPTMVFLDADGNVLHKIVGGTDPAGLLAQAAIAQDPTKQISTLEKRYANGERSQEFLATYMEALSTAYEQKKLAKIGSEFVANTKQKEFLKKDAFTILLNSGGLEYNSKLFKFIAANKSTLIANKEIGADNYNQLIGVSIDNHLKAYKMPTTIEALNKEIDGMRPYLDAAQVDMIEGQLQSQFYLANKKFSEWFDATIKSIDAAFKTDKRRGESMLVQNMFTIAMDPQFADAGLFPKAIQKMGSYSKENSSLYINYCLAALYKANGNKAKAIENINAFIAKNKEAGNPTDQRITDFKQSIENM
ncbi:thioredoxin domain-containing protein [Ancylomarina sp. 16SWW S1-10-2]|uniref:thioredoxin domain-containing protein n=1 Tax=Ancylomarina sp. 16SWW S1-10-2 TaxID=2499681 RepID=UPI0012ADFAE8|nr:thioredoxin domain-containing protein [Ancylomarina sp. 16SWW S1-10-2]MRT92231.1 DUF255 domain-containing protein [Ancylomarina sp. 16SWW S1-10-2]